MASARKSFCVIAAQVWCCGSSWRSSASPAAKMYAHDLDSLVYLSTDIVECRTVPRKPGNQNTPIEFDVHAVYKGPRNKGDTLPVIISSYRVRGVDVSALANGETMFLFITEPENLFGIPNDKGVYYPVESGIRLVDDGKVLTFRQLMNPGLYEAVMPGKVREQDPPTVEAFRAQLLESRQKVREYAVLLDPAYQHPDGKKLVSILAERPARTADKWNRFGDKNRICEVACARLAELRDPVFLLQAQKLYKENPSFPVLGRGFGTSKGRDFLLAKINDPKQDMETRLLCAKTLTAAGAIFNSQSILLPLPAGVRAQPVKLKVAPNNNGYLTRIAHAAVANEQNEELCITLINCLGGNVRENPPENVDARKLPSVSVQLSSDIQGSLSVLMELAGKNPTDKIRQALARVNPGGMLAAYRQVDLNRVVCKLEGSAQGRKLTLKYEYNAEEFDSDVRLRSVLILANDETKKKRSLPVGSVIVGGTRQGGASSFNVPADLPAGKYKVYLEVFANDKRVATTEQLIINLSAAKIAPAK